MNSLFWGGHRLFSLLTITYSMGDSFWNLGAKVVFYCVLVELAHSESPLLSSRRQTFASCVDLRFILSRSSWREATGWECRYGWNLRGVRKVINLDILWKVSDTQRLWRTELEWLHGKLKHWNSCSRLFQDMILQRGSDTLGASAKQTWELCLSCKETGFLLTSCEVSCLPDRRFGFIL